MWELSTGCDGSVQVLPSDYNQKVGVVRRHDIRLTALQHWHAALGSDITMQSCRSERFVAQRASRLLSSPSFILLPCLKGVLNEVTGSFSLSNRTGLLTMQKFQLHSNFYA
jgi:hypothetical protein